MSYTAGKPSKPSDGRSGPASSGSDANVIRAGNRSDSFCSIQTADGVRLAVGGVADLPVARDFPRLDGSAVDDALNAFAYELDARDDLHATARYRRDLARMIGHDLMTFLLCNLLLRII
jgi:2-furoyl-CoA dehydrogenase FAD binding subunit